MVKQAKVVSLKNASDSVAGKNSVHTVGIPTIVGIGASAGGLEALEQFLTHVPNACGIGFVVIQHLDPTYKGMLPELLQRATTMKVYQVTDGMKVESDCVYVIPPNKDMSILHGTLHLLDPVAPRGRHLSIDFFFRALAQDRQERAIGVILSGMGSDGTLGLRAIKEKAGLTLAQEPASAKFDSMPRSAIDAGVIDIVAPVESIPERIVDYLSRPHIDYLDKQGGETGAKTALEKIVTLLHDRTGNDFSLYKKSTVLRRIERRMDLHQITDLEGYVKYAHENPQELDLLFNELLIGVTHFFRDPTVWEYVKNEVLPALLVDYPAGKILRAWVPACSTGEEAYSLAMIFKEVLGKINSKGRFSLQIFATDLDPDAIARARQGMYPFSIAVDMPPERLNRFFISEESGYRLGKEIREMVIFAPQNVIMDPPFTRLDILSCRNLLIYLGQELQMKLIPLFHYSLNCGGFLLLGSAETIGNFTDLFEPLNNKERVYRRIDNPLRPLIEFPTKISSRTKIIQADTMTSPVPTGNLQQYADQLLLQNFSPAAVLVNSDGDILYINGRTGKYLEPAAGKANWNICAMANEGLRHSLVSALKKVVREQGTVKVENLQLTGNKGAEQIVSLTVQAIEKPDMERGMVLIIFSDVNTTNKNVVRRSAGANKTAQDEELDRARDEIRTLREEMQVSQEELTSSNEELQSTNEELQSTNEELTTSKEEMQSLNEELQSVNAELQSKVDDLSRVNNDMKNLLNSTDIATIFLDNAFHVRRFTNPATQIFKLIPSDVGRPLSDIVSDLHYPEMPEDVRKVLESLAFSEKQIETKDGRWFNVRIMPYRTLDNIIDGVVITFSDITVAKTLEAQLRSTQMKND